MADERIQVPAEWAASARYDAALRAAEHARSLADPDNYWRDQVGWLDWIETPTRMDESSFAEADFGIRWFADGLLNVAANCLDRHLATRPEQVAICGNPTIPPRHREPSPMSRSMPRSRASPLASRR